MVGSFRLSCVVTLDRRRSPARPSRGESRLLVEERREISAALIVAAAARDMDEERGEGVSCRFGGANVRGWIGEDDMLREGGSEFKSGAIARVGLEDHNQVQDIGIKMMHSQE